MTVRVAFYQTPAPRPKNGVGHYTAELLDALGQCASDFDVAGLPSGWLASACRLAHPLLAPKKKATGGAANAQALPASGRVKSIIRNGFRSAQRAYFWNLSRQLTGARF